MAEFADDDFRNDDPLIKRRQNINMLDEKKVVNRG
jgi:hypothetical protein